MAHVVRGDDSSHLEGLRCQDRVAVKRVPIRSWHPRTARLRPQFGRSKHHGGVERQLSERLLQEIEAIQSAGLVRTQQLPPDLVIGDFGNQDRPTFRQHGEQPLVAGSIARGRLRIRGHPQRPGIQQNDHSLSKRRRKPERPASRDRRSCLNVRRCSLSSPARSRRRVSSVCLILSASLDCAGVETCA